MLMVLLTLLWLVRLQVLIVDDSISTWRVVEKDEPGIDVMVLGYHWQDDRVVSCHYLGDGEFIGSDLNDEGDLDVMLFTKGAITQWYELPPRPEGYEYRGVKH